ncbi:MFS transporter [Streptomyces sp. NRRL S-87]|uniref:MFS transporter n=1 Tax=Streptomyces sp. NRRL S-87 TaxID=1463920 RepID=UPI00068DCC2E|nr:MFS transporter [Streptomyces sp. NRRL S-87]
MRKWAPLTAVCLGAFMLLVDVTIVTVALPDIAADTHTGFADLQWVMDVYLLALSGLLLGAGSLADRIGRRRVYTGGLVVFALASLACGLADGPVLLIGFRAVQGIGGAAMFATTMALLSAHYQGRDRAVAFGIWGAVNGAASAAGPILGGLLSEHVGWRWIFFVNVPLSALAVLVTLRSVRESRAPRAGRFDLPGLVTFTLGSAALTYALIEVAEDGWTGTLPLTCFAVAAAAFAAFLRVETRSAHPMVDPSLFRDPVFTGIMAAALLLSVAAFSYLLYVSLWLQSARGLGPVAAGLVLMPLSLAAFVVSAAAGRFLHGRSPRVTIGTGLLLIGAGAAAQALLLDPGDGALSLLPGLVLTGLGVGASTPQLASAAMAAVPPARAGMAGGAMNTARQLGMALGIAVLGVIFHNGLERGLGPAADLAGPLASGQGSAVAAGHPGLATAIDHGFVTGLRDTFLASAVLGLLGAALTFLLVRSPGPTAPGPVPAARTEGAPQAAAAGTGPHTTQEPTSAQ